MTSDGISDSDWETVRNLSAKVAQAQCAGCDAESDSHARELLRYLAVLEAKYGATASILATRADYVDDRAERIRLLELAWNVAKERSDWANCVFTSSSLAVAYIEELGSISKGIKWLRVFEESLEHYWDDDEHNEMLRLRKLIDQIGGKP
jgi:hypothetical protein